MGAASAANGHHGVVIHDLGQQCRLFPKQPEETHIHQTAMTIHSELTSTPTASVFLILHTIEDLTVLIGKILISKSLVNTDEQSAELFARWSVR